MVIYLSADNRNLSNIECSSCSNKKGVKTVIVIAELLSSAWTKAQEVLGSLEEGIDMYSWSDGKWAKYVWWNMCIVWWCILEFPWELFNVTIHAQILTYQVSSRKILWITRFMHYYMHYHENVNCPCFWELQQYPTSFTYRWHINTNIWLVPQHIKINWGTWSNRHSFHPRAH